MGCLFVVLLPFLPRLLVPQIYSEFPSQSGGGGLGIRAIGVL